MDYESMLSDLKNWNGLFGGGIPSKSDIEAAMRGVVDEETRRLMASYTHTLTRRIIIHTSASLYCDNWSFDEFKACIEDFIESVPSEYRTTARVELKGGYDETTELVMQYERPQTDEEWGLDIAHALMHARKHQADELAVYERLSRKFTAR